MGTLLAVAFEPFGVGVHGAEGVATLLLGVRFREPDPVALPDVAAIGVAQIAAHQVERQRVALDVPGKVFAFLPRPFDAERLQKTRPRLFGERREIALQGGRRIALDVLDLVARGDEAKPLARLRESLQ